MIEPDRPQVLVNAVIVQVDLAVGQVSGNATRRRRRSRLIRSYLCVVVYNPTTGELEQDRISYAEHWRKGSVYASTAISQHFLYLCDVRHPKFCVRIPQTKLG